MSIKCPKCKYVWIAAIECIICHGMGYIDENLPPFKNPDYDEENGQKGWAGE